MSVTELFPTLRDLPRADKLRVMQFLATELVAQEEPSLQPGACQTETKPDRS